MLQVFLIVFFSLLIDFVQKRGRESLAHDQPPHLRDGGIRYDDAGWMSGIIRDVRKMLQNHPGIDTRQTLIVNFNQFAASSLDFFIYTFTRTREWVRYHEVKQDVLLKTMDIIGSHGAECAFPTSTIHIPNGIPEPPAPVAG